MAGTYIKVETREIATGNVSIVETVRTQITNGVAGAPTTSVKASVKEGTYSSLSQVRDGLQAIVDNLTAILT